MNLCKNTDYQRRIWTTLVNDDTGTTLELGPDESAHVDVPDDFEDPYLKVVPEKPSRKSPSPSVDKSTQEEGASASTETKE
jgi:hypothetical protein